MKLLIIFALAVGTLVPAESLPQRILAVLPVVSHEAQARITNGQNAKPSQFPWQAALTMRIGGGIGFCGGTLISTRWVLTAAHCLDRVISVDVSLGSINRNNPESKVRAEKVIVHSKWRTDKMRYDIGLIRIPNVTLSANIGLATLPTAADVDASYEGEEAIATGWGRESDDAPWITDTLKWVVMTVISNGDCAKTFGNFITSDHLCVSTIGGTSTCNGDSGGSLTLKSTGTHIGITSFGSVAGCESGRPAAFTRTSNFINWINSQINSSSD